MNNSEIDNIYDIDNILKEHGINREVFYNIIKMLKITDRLIECKVLGFILTKSRDDLKDLADIIKQVKIKDRKPPRRRRRVVSKKTV